jgi:hypothetical protein
MMSRVKVVPLDRKTRDILVDRDLIEDQGMHWKLLGGVNAVELGKTLDAVVHLQEEAASLDIDVRLIVGGREFVLSVAKNGEQLEASEGVDLRAIADELELSQRLEVSPASLARLRRKNQELLLRLLSEWGVFSDYEVALRLGWQEGNPARFVTRLTRQKAIVGVRPNSLRVFPRFQFDPDGEPLPVIATVLDLLPPRWTNRDRVMWFGSPNGWLTNRRPADLINTDAEGVVYAAKFADSSAGDMG